MVAAIVAGEGGPNDEDGLRLTWLPVGERERAREGLESSAASWVSSRK